MINVMQFEEMTNSTSNTLHSKVKLKKQVLLPMYRKHAAQCVKTLLAKESRETIHLLDCVVRNIFEEKTSIIFLAGLCIGGSSVITTISGI